MQNDSVIWDIINHSFCSFKSKVARERTFCQNPYNVTGLCIRSACPLANSQYATIREEEGVCYLFIKTVERAHTPKFLWEKIKLPANYTKALEIVSANLEHFPKYLVHRNKQRLTKIHQMIIRMRKIKLKAKLVISLSFTHTLSLFICLVYLHFQDIQTYLIHIHNYLCIYQSILTHPPSPFSPKFNLLH